MEAMETYYFTTIELDMMLQSVSFDCLKTEELINKMSDLEFAASERALTENLKALDNLKMKITSLIVEKERIEKGLNGIKILDFPALNQHGNEV